MKRNLINFILLMGLYLIQNCTRNTLAVDSSLSALKAARASQESSLKTLKLMSEQANKSAADGKIAESANKEIQDFVVTERAKIEQHQRELEVAEKEVEEYRSGRSKKREHQVLEQINKTVIASSEQIRILDKKTEVVVDFLGNVTFSKSEIGALFRPGEYNLIPEQVKEGELLFRPIVEKLYNFANKYKGSFRNLKGEIIVTGYSDATPVEKSSTLYTDLARRLQLEKITVEPITINQKLSELRAAAVKELLSQIISKRLKANNEQLTISIKILGRGEDLPPGLPTNIAKNDARRRVVTFYWVVLPSL